MLYGLCIVLIQYKGEPFNSGIKLVFNFRSIGNFNGPKPDQLKKMDD